MSIKANLVIHPYTAKKDLGAGHDRYAYELLKWLPNYDVDVSVIDSGHLTTITQAALAETKVLGRLLFSRPKGVFHATATMNAMAPITVRKKPIVTTIHDVLWFHVKDRFDSKLKAALKTAGIKRAAKKSHGIIVPFRSIRDFLVNELGIKSEKIFIVPYGVDHDVFKPIQPGEQLERPSFLKEGRNVLFVGAVNLAKGIDTLIKSFEKVVDSVQDAHLIVGSKGWDVPLVKDVWQSSAVKDRIHFIGFIPEDQLRAAYVYADVAAFPSRYGFGLPTLESMACGTSTVSSRALDAPEFVDDAGLMADPDDSNELASQIIRLLSDDDFRQEIEKKGLKKSSQYSWDRTAQMTAEVYRTIGG